MMLRSGVETHWLGMHRIWRSWRRLQQPRRGCLPIAVQVPWIRTSSAPAGGPFTVTAESSSYPTSTLVSKDVYVGSVWLLVGQSNIVLALGDMLIGRTQPWRTLAQRQLDGIFWEPIQDVRIYQVRVKSSSLS